MKYSELRFFSRRADQTKGDERERLVEELIRELPKLDPFEGFSEGAVWFAKLVARLKWVDFSELS